MIRPPAFRGAAFGDAGDDTEDESGRVSISNRLGISVDWGRLRQVHGRGVVRARGAGVLGEADAAFTTEVGLPLAVYTADCFPVIIEGAGGIGIAHAGWRGAAAGVVAGLRTAMVEAGIDPLRAAVGPGIGPCCFEVGPDVARRFPGCEATTTWGTVAVDLRAAIVADLAHLEVWVADACTMCGDGYHSFRRDRTSDRQATVAWLPV